MFRNHEPVKQNRRGFSLTEMLVVVAGIGILCAIGVQTIGGLSDTAKETAARRNAQNLASFSAVLSSLGVAHVIPESLGGKEATCRLIKHGVIVPSGPMKGTYYGIPGLPEERIPSAAVYLEISYENLYVLRMIYDGNAIP